MFVHTLYESASKIHWFLFSTAFFFFLKVNGQDFKPEYNNRVAFLIERSETDAPFIPEIDSSTDVDEFCWDRDEGRKAMYSAVLITSNTTSETSKVKIIQSGEEGFYHTSFRICIDQPVSFEVEEEKRKECKHTFIELLILWFFFAKQNKALSWAIQRGHYRRKKLFAIWRNGSSNNLSPFLRCLFGDFDCLDCCGSERRVRSL